MDLIRVLGPTLLTGAIIVAAFSSIIILIMRRRKPFRSRNPRLGPPKTYFPPKQEKRTRRYRVP